jgi:ABC-type antimicrobial peptide transport system permease subunit
MSNAVTRRWPELGLRMAVGARPSDIVALVLRQAARPMLVGLAIGVAAALATARLVASLIYGVGPADPSTYVVVTGGLLLVGLAASVLPARRASRLDPRMVLQQR